uniref:Uncharacterized protein n=1 Tax=Lygus hesperus TaxID=30085 RepID=A0A0A9Y741_LYGHE
MPGMAYTNTLTIPAASHAPPFITHSVGAAAQLHNPVMFSGQVPVSSTQQTTVSNYSNNIMNSSKNGHSRSMADKSKPIPLLPQPSPPHPSNISITRTANNLVTTLDRPPFHTGPLHSFANDYVVPSHFTTNAHALSVPPPLPVATSIAANNTVVPPSPTLQYNSASNSTRVTPLLSVSHNTSLIAKRVPVRMSPAITPSSMNPNAL